MEKEQAMETEQVRDLRIKSIIRDGESSIIGRLDDGRMFKLVKDVVHENCNLVGISYESKILNSAGRHVDGIVMPITAVYVDHFCVGYTMNESKGNNLNVDNKRLTMRERGDLHRYFEIYRKIEELVIKANEKDIVLPDLCTCDNIIITPNGDVEFIDYDGMQIGEYDKVFCLSSSLGDPMKYLTSEKFSSFPYHLTKEMDKTSLTILMFLCIFGIDLTKIGFIDPVNGKAITLKDMFDFLGIDDIEFMNKVEANLSLDKEGSFLTSDLHRIASNYNMKASNAPFKPGMYIKRLTKK